MMQPTVPAWVSWYRRLRPAELPRAHDRPAARARAPARVAVYTSVFNSRDNQNLHLIRLDDMLGKQHMFPTPPNEWLKRLNINADMWRTHISPEISRQALEYQQRLQNYQPVSIMVPPSSNDGVGAPGRAQARGQAGAVWGGWAAGALLLALLVLLVRAAERCLDRRLFKRRRQSEEWPTPNVMATSLQQQSIEVGAIPHLDDAEFSSSSSRNPDLPPPYSECAPGAPSVPGAAGKQLGAEEPPPPYSACLVAFSNKHDPTVVIHALHEQPPCTSQLDNLHNDLIETRNRLQEDDCRDDPAAVQLVFDNGRIVERTLRADSADAAADDVDAVDASEAPGGDDSTERAEQNTEHDCQRRVVLV